MKSRLPDWNYPSCSHDVSGPHLRLLLWVALLLLSCRAQAEDGDEFFHRHVEPLLRSRCYTCHSHRADEINSGLTLDWRSGWSQGGDRGPAVVPGKPDQSLLIRAVRHEDPELRMPEEKLPEAEIAVLVEWVSRGAPDPRQSEPAAKATADWWSLRPLVRPELPTIGATHPVDAFVRAELRKHQLTPSPSADRRTLIRRLYFDLIGLTPIPEEVDEFIASMDSGVWENLIDQLLASPRYGERWARHWLDTIHFADTHGFEHDVFRPNAWRYRDYVINSFNLDTAWARFIREQLAADAFFPDQPALTVALGYLGAGPYDQSAAGTAPMSFEYLDRDDLVTQTMAAFVSTTANCARCHTHKFDPITQEDYFCLQAVFAGVGKGDVSFDPDADVARQRATLQRLKAAAESRDGRLLLTDENASLVAEWEGRRAAPVWSPLNPETYLSADGATLQRESDASVISGGNRPDRDVVTVTAASPIPGVSALRLDVLSDDSLPMRGPGRMDNGNLHLSELELYLFRTNSSKPQRIAIHLASADFEQDDWTIAHSVDGDVKTAWGIHPSVGKSHHAVFELAEPINVGTQDKLCVVLKQLYGRGHLIGRCRLSVTDARAESIVALPQTVEASLARPLDQRTVEERIGLASIVLRRYADESIAKLPTPVKIYAAGSQVENERGHLTYDPPRPIRILKRGDLNSPGEEVGPGSLSAVQNLQSRFQLSENANESARRACLADWIANPENPLTWRSIANRVWHYHFGFGLCDTPSDFGRMGGVPSHPELLDWLAVELRDSGGSLKHLHRIICTSETYRQSSAIRAEPAALDPRNRWLWRMNRQRLDADSYRDAVQQVSGRLDLSMHGPGTQHFLSSPGPQNTPSLDFQSFDWSSRGATRRSIYRVVWRAIPDPFMDQLDFPDASLLTPVRGFSSSPLQSLALLNNEFVLWHSREFARRLSVTCPTRELGTTDPIRTAVRLAWLRNPTDDEMNMLVALAEKHSLAAVCRLLLNSNEFLFLD